MGKIFMKNIFHRRVLKFFLASAAVSAALLLRSCEMNPTLDENLSATVSGKIDTLYLRGDLFLLVFDSPDYSAKHLVFEVAVTHSRGLYTVELDPGTWYLAARLTGTLPEMENEDDITTVYAANPIVVESRNDVYNRVNLDFIR